MRDPAQDLTQCPRPNFLESVHTAVFTAWICAFRLDRVYPFVSITSSCGRSERDPHSNAPMH
eukprot:scaffold259994_cov19-Prasinocladus_malaysianus.AAC.1